MAKINATMEQTIGVLLAASTFGDLSVRSLYMGPLLRTLRNYLESKRSERVDEVRNAILAVCERLMGGRKNDAYREFRKYFICSADLWTSDYYYSDAMIVDGLVAIEYALEVLKQAQAANAARLSQGTGAAPAGQARAGELFDEVLEIAQKIAGRYDLYTVDSRTMSQIMENSQREASHGV